MIERSRAKRFTSQQRIIVCIMTSVCCNHWFPSLLQPLADAWLHGVWGDGGNKIKIKLIFHVRFRSIARSEHKRRMERWQREEVWRVNKAIKSNGMWRLDWYFRQMDEILMSVMSLKTSWDVIRWEVFMTMSECKRSFGWWKLLVLIHYTKQKLENFCIDCTEATFYLQ